MTYLKKPINYKKYSNVKLSLSEIVNQTPLLLTLSHLPILDSNTMDSMETTEITEESSKPSRPEKKVKTNDYGIETRKIAVPKHRFAPLKENWLKIFNPVVEHLKLQIRFNLKTRNVEIRTGKETQNISDVQKGKNLNITAL